MSQLSRIITLGGLTCLFLCFAIPAHADDLYKIDGTITFVGNNACESSPCTQTIDFSLDFEWQFNGTLSLYQAHPFDLVANWSGPLGTFTQNVAQPPYFSDYPGIYGLNGCLSEIQNYFEFWDSANGGPSPTSDEIDMTFCKDYVPTPITPSIWFADLFNCGTATCLTDFYPPSGREGNDYTLAASITYTVTQVPEPATIPLLAFGLLVLGLARAASSRNVLRKHAP
ncbi:MAG: PEP-CTERM sorting domain-containing protein [Acidobacteriota bacterium]|nr:PEP-CTERM sorting domain-containing protein [Acidobacteriota bacterium]